MYTPKIIADHLGVTLDLLKVWSNRAKSGRISEILEGKYRRIKSYKRKNTGAKMVLWSSSRWCNREIDSFLSKEEKSQIEKTLDEVLEKLYNLWFSQPNLDLTSKDSTGFSAIEYARKFPYGASLIERMEKYE